YACHNCREGFLQLRSSRQGKFWGCSTYPACQTIVNDKRGKPESWRKKDA
ncbi:MAG: topoisomerase DNA-binding C4 zinc finger domain-containing protein, partial [Gammaproteobacteria bacterium]|nr:topoisomerase DNA-binding C4 zinc finger domain-containing protein [Gammaproteobacteria bacterium]